MPLSLTRIHLAQVYDHDAAAGFPIFSQVLAAAAAGRRHAGPEWIDLVDACKEWRDGTHPAVWEAIVNLDVGLGPAPTAADTPAAPQAQGDGAAGTGPGLTEAMLRLHLDAGGGA